VSGALVVSPLPLPQLMSFVDAFKIEIVAMKGAKMSGNVPLHSHAPRILGIHL